MAKKSQQLTASELAAVQAVEADMTETVALVKHKLTREGGLDALSDLLRDAIRAGNLTVIEAAIWHAEHENDALADSVLRRTWQEMFDADVPRSRQLDAFAGRAMGRAPTPRGRGSFTKYDFWMRDFGIIILIRFSSIKYGIRPTESRGDRRANAGTLSGCSVTATAMGRNHLHPDSKDTLARMWAGKSIPTLLAREYIEKNPMEAYFR